jgi:hypothetical protein
MSPTFGTVRRQLDSRSANALSQGLSFVPAFLAAALYLSRSPGVTRTFIRTLAGSFFGGCPLGLLGLSTGRIMYSQIILDKPFPV